MVVSVTVLSIILVIFITSRVILLIEVTGLILGACDFNLESVVPLLLDENAREKPYFV